MFKNIQRIHFVGIGGSGMSGIAEVLLKLGYHVSGSDLQSSAVVKRLESLGAQVGIGHKASNLGLADVVVISTAVSKSNPEVQAALKKGIPVIPRVEMLAELARLKYTIAIAGTHGKTTTSSLVAQVLKEGGLDPTVIVGGRLKAVGTGGILGRGDYLVAEADESDGSFLKLDPALAIITNIDDDHLDYYGTSQKLNEAFVQFADRIPFYGMGIFCGDNPRLKKILPRVKRRFKTYGFSKSCDYSAANINSSDAFTRFDVVYQGKNLGSISLSLPGDHNILNALAAVVAGLTLNLKFSQIALAIEQFEGVGRRMEFKGMASGVTVLDDYGHHPTEMEATVRAIKKRWPKSKLHVVFQPHRFSRTQLLAKEFGKVLTLIDTVYLMPIYPAGEKPLRGVSSQSISKHIKKKNWEMWDSKTTFKKLQARLKTGDILLTLGAGDVWKVGETLVLKSHSLAAKLAEACPSLSKRIKTEEPLSRHCTWAIGGPAEVFVEVRNFDELKSVTGVCSREKVNVFLLGWGSNILLPDEGLRGCVIRLRGQFESIDIQGTRVTVGAGVHLPKLSRRCAQAGLSGVESLAGIPGSVGGALITNAGTKNGSIGDVLQSVTILNEDGSTQVLTKEKIETKYRWTNLKDRWIISADLDLKPSKNGEAWKGIKDELDYRQKTQPLGTKNVGSVFCNPPNDFAARLIEAVGLKGKKMGQLRFSPKHSNFIENMGGGTAQDALNLIHEAQKRVKEKFNVELTPEVRIIKDNR